MFWQLPSGVQNGGVSRFSSGPITRQSWPRVPYSACDPPLVYFLRSLSFIEAHFDFKHKVIHIPWEENGIADANDMSIFSSLLPQATPLPSAIPQSLIELLSDWSLLWISPGWRGLLRSLLREVSQQEQ